MKASHDTPYWRLGCKISEKKYDLELGIHRGSLGPIAVLVFKEEIEELEKEKELHKAVYMKIYRAEKAKEIAENQREIEESFKGKDVRIHPDGYLVEVIGALGLQGRV